MICCCQKCLCEGPKSDSHHQMMMQDFKKRFIASIIVTFFILALSPMIQNLLNLQDLLSFQRDIYVLFALSSFVFFYGGWPFLSGMMHELKNKSPGMMALIGLAIITAYGYSALIVFGFAGKLFFWELGTLIDIMLIGHYIEMKSIMGAGKALQKLAKLMPSTAHKKTDDTIEDVPLSDLKNDDILLVKPGEKIPADGQIMEGESEINEAMLTGESKPVFKSKDDHVIGGSINGNGSLTIRVEKTGKESYLSKVIELVKQAQESKSRTQDLANRAALWLTIIALIGGLSTFLVWFFFSSESLSFSLERTVSVMVITCPHALGLAVPLVVAVSTAIAANKGLLIRNRTAFEAARNINAVVFDKTGTLTQGEFGITDIVAFDGDEKMLVQYAASIEAHSEHPIAKGIAKDQQILEVKQFQSITGKGAEGIVNEKKIQVVSPGFLKEQAIDFDESLLEKYSEDGKTVVFVLIDNQLRGLIALADLIRPESKEAIEKLKQMGIYCMMVTGDNPKVAKWVASSIGLDEYFAEVLPKDKSNKIKEIQKRDYLVAMTGDGINDAPALAQSDLGIAIGAGTDVAIETADIILVKSNPLDIVSITSLARSTYRKMIQNLIWATAYNVVAIPIAAGVLSPWGILLSPAVAAIFMSLSTVICAVNAQFLKAP